MNVSNTVFVVYACIGRFICPNTVVCQLVLLSISLPFGWNTCVICD